MKNEKDYSVREININVENLTDHDTLEKYFEIQKIIPIETSKKTLISIGIEKILSVNNTILIQDINHNIAVKKFDSLGKFLGNIGEIGDGPGEYISNDYIYVNKFDKTINLYDRSKMSVHLFDLFGNYKRTKKIPQMYFTGIEVIDKGKSLYYFCNDANYQFFKNKENYRFIISEDNFHILGKYLPEPIININSVAYVNQNFCLKSPLGYIISENMNDTIYILRDDTIRPNAIVNFGRNSLPPNFLSTPLRPENGVVDKLRYAQNKNLAYISDLVYENNRYIYIGYSFKYTKNFAIVDKILKDKISTSRVFYSIQHKMIFPPPRYYDGEHFVSVLSAHDFKNLVNFWRKRNSLSEEIINIEKSIKPEDNPVLVFLNLKEK